MAFVAIAVNIDSIIAPTRIQITPNKRPREDFGILSPYLLRQVFKTSSGSSFYIYGQLMNQSINQSITLFINVSGRSSLHLRKLIEDI